ncbi:MAG: sulfotransferase, partial [Hyphomicrobiales bacterium]|nr:sulfotransferase [Hyphomicrobiales bacterium]
AEAREAGRGPLAWRGCKEVWTVDFLPALARALPDARFVIVLRDPRAVLASLIAMAAGDPSQHAHGVSYLRHWRKLVALVTLFQARPDLAPRLTVARFETMCHAAETEAGRLGAFLGLPFEAAMLHPGGENGWQGNSSFGAIGTGISPAAAEGWRRRIAPADHALAEFLCAPEMAAAGYEPDAVLPEPTDAVLRRMLDFHDDPGSWRSDSGDPFADLAWEALRHRLWRAPPSLPETGTLMARCFLNPDVLQQRAE